MKFSKQLPIIQQTCVKVVTIFNRHVLKLPLLYYDNFIFCVTNNLKIMLSKLQQQAIVHKLVAVESLVHLNG